eukprot:4919104-Amphidinium_carterae.1
MRYRRYVRTCWAQYVCKCCFSLSSRKWLLVPRHNGECQLRCKDELFLISYMCSCLHVAALTA